MNILIKVIRWYKSNCDGDWEHSYGLKIDTLDNPGWRVEFDLFDTELEGIEFSDINKNLSNDNWIRCYVKDDVFYGFGGIDNLEEILIQFLKLTES